MSGNGSTSSIEETAPGQDEVRSDGGLLHRLGRFLRGISLRCRRGIDRHRQRRRTTEDKNPRNSVQKDSSDGNQSSTARQGKQDSDEDGTVITEEKTTTVSKCQLSESTISEPTLHVPHEHDALQYHHGDTDGERPGQILPGPVFQEKDNTCNTSRPSTLPILDGSQTSTELHQLLQKENISEKSPKDLSSHIHNTAHVVQSTSATLVKSRHYPSLRTEVTKDLSKNESLFTTNGHITDSQQPSFRWLVDSRKTATDPLGDSDHAFGIDLVQSKSVDQQENIPIRGPSVPQTLTDHTKLLDSVARVSIWNRLPSRHKRTLNFSRNYVQYGNNDIQDIELEIQPTVDEWCSKQQNDTPDDSNEEKFQPLLKLAITDKPVEIPQSRNTKSHDIIECFRSPQLDKPEGDRYDLTTVEQGLHVGVVAHHQDIVREYKTEENDYIANDLSVVNRQNQQMLTNIAQPDSKNERHPDATNDVLDSPGQQPKTRNSQNSVEALKGQELDTTDRQQPKTLNSQNSVEALKGQELDTTDRQQPKTLNSQISVEALKGQERDTTDRQKSKPTNGQQQIDSNDHVTSTKGQTPKATGVKQPQGISKQEKISSQKLETSNRHKRTERCGDLQKTPQMSQEATLGEEARVTHQNLEETPGQEPKVMDCEHQGQINSRHSESTIKVQNPAITARRKQPSRLADGQQPTIRNRLILEATDNQSSVTTNGQQSGLNSSQEINQEKHTIVAEQCEDITFDEEVLPIQTVRHRQDQACNDTEMCDDNMNQMIKKELSRSKDKTTTHGEWSRAQTDSQLIPIEITMVTSDINREMEHEPLKPSPEHRLTRTEKNDDISTTNGATKLKTSSALFPSPQGGVYELSVKQHDCAMFENQANKYRELNANDAGCLNISSTTKQTSNVKHGVMCLDNSFDVAATNRSNHSNVSTAKRVIVNKAFFISRQNSEPKYTNRESTKEANVNQIYPTKQLSVDGKKDSLIHTSGQRNVEPVVEDSKFNTDTTGKLSDRDVNETVSVNVSIDQTRSVESSSEETSFRNGLIQDTSFPEFNRGQPNQKQSSQEDQMKLHVDSTHDQTTIESDFSEDGSGDLFHSETAQDVEIDKILPCSPQTNPSATQQKEKSHQENAVLLDKRDRLMKPLMENIKNASNGTSPKEVARNRTEGEIYSDERTLQKGDKHSNSMPNIQPPTVHNENGKRHVVIKYKRQPYPPEGRPLSASMGAFRFRKIQGVYGQLKKAQSSEDLRVDEGTVTKGSGDGTIKHNDDISSNYTKECSDIDIRNKTNQKSSSNPLVVNKPTTREIVTIPKKIMTKRKPAVPPLLRFTSYKVDDDMHTPSLFESTKRSTGVEGFTKDINMVGRTTEPIGQSYLEPHDYRHNAVDLRANAVSLSPGELAFAQKLSPGERKNMPSSEMEKVEYPVIVSCNSKQQLPESNIPRVDSHSRDKTVKNSYSNTEIEPGLVYSENQREPVLHGSLSGSASSGSFLKNAMIERRVVLPSRYSARSQKADPSSPTKPVQYGSTSDPRPRQQLENKLPLNKDSSSPMLLFSKRTYSPRVHPASKRMMIKRDTLPSSSLTERTVVTTSERPDNNNQGAHTRSDYTRQQSYPPISSSASAAISVDCEHDSLMLNNRETENESSNVRTTLETSDGREIVEEREHNFSPSQNIGDQNISSNNMSGSKTSSMFLDTAISERRSIFPSRLRSKAQNSTAGIGPPVLASQGNTTGLRYEQIISESNTPYEDESAILTENIGIKTDNPRINTGTKIMEVNMTTDNTQVKDVCNSAVQRDDSLFQQTSSDVNSVTSGTVHKGEPDNLTRENIQPTANKHVHRPIRAKNVVSSRPANQIQYGSSSDPRRRQQLEKARPGNTYSESKTKPFSKSTDYPRERLASKRKMIGRRTLSTSKVTRGTGGEEIASDEISGNDLGVHSQTQQSDEVSGNDLRVHSQTQLSDEISGNDLRVHSQTKQSGQTGYPLINNTSPTATSDNGGHDFLMPNDRDVGTEYSHNEMISEVHDAFEIMENNDQVLSRLNNVEDESVTTNNMSGSKTSSTFLNTAISERRSIFPSRLRSKAHISTAGIGPPVLASQGITTGLRFEQIISESNTPYELVSESAMEDGNPMPAESSGMEVDDALENTDLEGFEVNTATENTKVMINDGNEFHRDGTTPQQIKCVANSATLQTSHHEEANSPREGNVSLDESKGIQLPVPKPIEKLVPSQFPVNKHKLPTVSSPQRETIATPVKALPPSRIRTSTSSVADDSVDGRQTVKPIIRKPPMESIPSVPKKIKNFRFRQKMVLTGRLHHKSEENLKFFKQITKTTNDFYKEHARNT